jgi:glycerophosphoryl diester phosphodiesterase
VILHDDTVDRTTNGRGRVSDLTAAELGRLDLGNGGGVPTLDELFRMLGRQPLYNVELKTRGAADRGLEAAVAGCIRAHDLTDRVLVSSFSLLALRRARRTLPPAVPLGLLRERPVTRLACRLLGVQADHPEHRLIDAATMAWARANGYRVHAWTVDDPAEARRLVALGVQGIITNRPGLIRESLAH